MAVGGAELSSGGPGLMFIYLVNIMNTMAGGRIIEVVFYVCVLFAGGSSIVNLYEATVAFLQEKDRKSTRLKSSHANISYFGFCLKKKKKKYIHYHQFIIH